MPMLLPPAPDKCPICAVDHPADQPHDAQSLYYQYRFRAVRGRWPTWADAIAHCTADVQAAWREQLTACNAWSEPESGGPVADPPHDSINQPVGDVNSRTFGPKPDDTMIDFNATAADHDLIAQIAARAVDVATLPIERLTVEMDLTACHLNGCPLNLPALLDADAADFSHDIMGINRHLDRNNGKLRDCFLPRFAAKTNPA